MKCRIITTRQIVHRFRGYGRKQATVAKAAHTSNPEHAASHRGGDFKQVCVGNEGESEMEDALA